MAVKAIGMKTEWKYRAAGPVWLSGWHRRWAWHGMARCGSRVAVAKTAITGWHDRCKRWEQLWSARDGGPGRVMIQYSILGFGGADGGRGPRGRSMMRNVGAV